MNETYVRPEFESYVTIKSYLSVAQARVAQSTLASFGIESLLSDDSTIGLDWSYATALGGVKLMVPSEDTLWALHYLDQKAEPIFDSNVVSISEEQLESDIMPLCPDCNSDRVYPIDTKKKVGIVLFVSSIGMLVAGIAALPLTLGAMALPSFRTLLTSEFECRECSLRFC